MDGELKTTKKEERQQLEDFVYSNIREEDFERLLDLPAAETGSSEQHLREDLFFVLSRLDPARMPKTTEVLNSELAAACRGAAPVPHQRLASILRLGARWGLVAEPLKSTWEILREASLQLGKRKPATSSTKHALTLAEECIRDGHVREGVVVPHLGDLQRVVELIMTAFCNALRSGFASLFSAGARGSAGVKVLGPDFALWPRLLGFALRAAVHMEHRNQTGKDKLRTKKQEVTHADENQKPGMLTPKTLQSLLPALTGQAAETAIKEAEGSAEEVSATDNRKGAGATGESNPPSKRARISGASDVIPQDVEELLQIHMRILEAMSANNFLSMKQAPTQKSSEDAGDAGTEASNAGTESSGIPSMRVLESNLQRWARVADTLQPRRDGTSRLSEAWDFQGRLLQQMSAADAPTTDVLKATEQLLGRVTNEVPTDEASIIVVLRSLFRKFEYAPGLAELVQKLTGACKGVPTSSTEDAGDAPVTPGKASPDDVQASSAESGGGSHTRVQEAIRALLPLFRGLQQKPAPEPDADRRQTFAAPSKGRKPVDLASLVAGHVEGEPEEEDENMGEEMPEEEDENMEEAVVRVRDPSKDVD